MNAVNLLVSSLVIRLIVLVGLALSAVALFVPIVNESFTGNSEDREQLNFFAYWFSIITRFGEEGTDDVLGLRILIFILLGGVLAALVVPHFLVLSAPSVAKAGAARIIVIIATIGLVLGAVWFMLGSYHSDPMNWIPIVALLLLAVHYAVLYVLALDVSRAQDADRRAATAASIERRSDF